MSWQDLGAALALLLVLEGLLPFLNPDGLKRAIRVIANMDDNTLRFAGLTSMVIGVFLLTLVR